MEVYDVGPGDMSYSDDFSAEVYTCVIAWYEDGDYSGSGIAAAFRKDGFVEYADLSHCSCYGPTEDWSSKSTQVDWKTFRRFDKYDQDMRDRIRLPADTDFVKWQAIVAKAKELKAARKL